MGADAAAEEQFGPYLVYERLGVGGMATVHRALERDVAGSQRVVALKRLLPHLAEDASFIKAFVREAKLASLLTHVNIVAIYELGRVGTEYFISMEYIDGYDVRRVLRHARKVTGPPPIHITAGLVLQLCDALEYAHTRVDEDGHPLGLVHRDVSPSNLLVTTAGHLKVIDFGIAKAQSSQLRTQTGRVKGKLAYMAPEAVSGSRELDARSDVWAVGVILHELLTARPLFASKNEYQTLLKVQRGDIMPPSTFNQSCPPELDAIVFKALARDPDERFSSADELRTELDDVRLRYQLQAGYRDVAAWIDWAFSLDPPAGASAESGVTRAPTPRPPRNRDDDEAVELVWGSGDDAGTDDPLVLDDVPDVSEKHLVRSDTEVSIDDDLPTPQPSHGGLRKSAALYGRSSRASIAPAGSNPGPPPRTAPILAHGTDRPGARTTRPTNPLDAPNLDDRMLAQRARDSEPPPHLVDDALSRAETTVTTDTEGLPLTNPAARPMAGTAPIGSKLSADDLFGPDPDAAETVVGSLSAANADATLEHMEAVREHVETPPVAAPVIRFSKSIPAASPLDTAAPLRPPPQTKPGVLPASAHVRAPKPKPSVPLIAATTAAREPSRRGLVVVAGLLIVGGAATAVTVVLTTGGDSATTTTRPEPPPSVAVREPGTVRFVIEPRDAEIRIEGQLHTGSPWSAELPPGIHQIEIRRAGYKARVTSIELSAKETQTFDVALEPLGSAAASDATLSVTTMPLGLEVVVDGVALPDRTPIKLATLTPGPHAIVLRRDGVVVWHQNINAEASSDYEFNPSFTAAGPLTVAPTAVTKLAGEPPNLAKLDTGDLPSAKVCIDTFGAVSSVEIVNKLAPRAADELVRAIQTWRYAPYKRAGVALSVCFVVTVRPT